MKIFSWSPEKNRRLRKERGIAFEEVLFHIAAGDILDVLEHPNLERYAGQKIYVLSIEDYAYLVPFVETDEEIFLRTIFPSRKATRQYLGVDDGDERDDEA